MAAMGPEVMDAFVVSEYGEPEKTIKKESVPIPKITTKDELLIEVYTASMNPIDWKISTGALPFRKPPYTTGGDFCGKIIAKGEEVSDDMFKVGDMVCGVTTQGSFAQYVIAKAAVACLMPAKLNTLEAASLSLASNTAYQSLVLQGKVEASTKLLILGGTTAVGMSAIQIAKNELKCESITVTSSQEEKCKGLGADRVINYRKEEWPVALKGGKFDVIFDCVGGRESWDKALSEDVLAEKGQFVSISGNDVKQGTARYALYMLDSSKTLLEVCKLVDAGKLKVFLDEETPFKFDDCLKMFEKSKAGKARGKLAMYVKADGQEAAKEESKEDK